MLNIISIWRAIHPDLTGLWHNRYRSMWKGLYTTTFKDTLYKVNIMNTKTIIGSVLIAVFVWFVATQCCVYTSIAVFTVADVCGMEPVICSAEVEGRDHYHAYVRIGSDNIETQTLNLYHSSAVDYTNPVYVFVSATDFMDAVDMASPIKF